jgi:hypothetical protein
MTPKEKAEVLFKEYYSYLKANLMNDKEAWEDAKVCALIAVNELIIVCKYYNDTQAELNYWYEVEQEIQNI